MLAASGHVQQFQLLWSYLQGGKDYYTALCKIQNAHVTNNLKSSERVVTNPQPGQFQSQFAILNHKLLLILLSEQEEMKGCYPLEGISF